MIRLLGRPHTVFYHNNGTEVILKSSVIRGEVHLRCLSCRKCGHHRQFHNYLLTSNDQEALQFIQIQEHPLKEVSRYQCTMISVEPIKFSTITYEDSNSKATYSPDENGICECSFNWSDGTHMEEGIKILCTATKIVNVKGNVVKPFSNEHYMYCRSGNFNVRVENKFENLGISRKLLL